MLNYAAVKVSDLERSGAFYDSILAPLGWRRQEAPANSVSWGLIKAEFFIELSDTQRPGYGLISFPAKSIPAVKASFESGSAERGRPGRRAGQRGLVRPGHLLAVASTTPTATWSRSASRTTASGSPCSARGRGDPRLDNLSRANPV